MLAVVLALSASVVVGASDYLGGRASEQRHPAVTAVWTQGIMLVCYPLITLAIGWDHVSTHDIALGAVSGLFTGAAYIAFFAALSTGHMGAAAPTTAVTAAVIPVLYDLVRGTTLRPGVWVGVVIALAAVALVSAAAPDTSSVARPSVTARRRAAVLGGVAGAAFSMYYILLSRTSEASGTWPALSGSLTGMLAPGALVAVRSSRRREARSRPSLHVVGAGLTAAIAGACFVLALQRGPLAVVTVLGSLYPVVTVTLAVRFARETLTARHVVGLIAAVAGAGTVAAFS